MVRKTHWFDYTSAEFAGLDPERTVAVVPVCAVEQHGPHLTVGTDTVIGEGMMAEVLARLPDDLTILVLPTQSIGKSNEHLRSPGTITMSAETALRVWVEMGESVARAGLRKLVLVNSHGGNVDLLSIAARELRVKAGMMVVHTAWGRLGKPDGLFDAVETQHGIHGGDVETSLVLHFRPDLVRMENAQNFVSSALAIEAENEVLRLIGPATIGWIAPDVNPHGVAGNASAATAQKGRAVAAFQAERFITLLREIARYPLSRLA